MGRKRYVLDENMLSIVINKFWVWVIATMNMALFNKFQFNQGIRCNSFLCTIIFLTRAMNTYRSSVGIQFTISKLSGTVSLLTLLWYSCLLERKVSVVI